MTNIKSFILLLIFIYASINAQTGWFIQAPFTPKSFYCMEPTAIHNLYCGSDSGIIFGSTNNGYNWTVVIQDTSVKRLPIKFIWGGNNDDFNAVGDSTAYISKTGNNVIASHIANSNRSNLKAFAFIQGCCQYEVYETAGDSGIFYINDGIWRRDTAAARIAAGIRLNSASSYIFVGDNGLIMKADSIGLPRPNTERMRWRVVPSGTTQNLYGVRVSSSGVCIAVGAAGTILKSTNSGDSWTSLSSPVTDDLYCITFGYSNLICGANGVILKSTVNNIDTWFRQSTPTTLSLHTIQTLSYTDFIAMGNNGIILRTTDGGGPPAGITQINHEIPEKFELNQNYPNPFNPVTIINFKISNKGFVKLKIYDAAGKEVVSLVDKYLSAGTYSAAFDGSGMASGVYIYKLEAANFMESRKMVLIK